MYRQTRNRTTQSTTVMTSVETEDVVTAAGGVEVWKIWTMPMPPKVWIAVERPMKESTAVRILWLDTRLPMLMQA